MFYKHMGINIICLITNCACVGVRLDPNHMPSVLYMMSTLDTLLCGGHVYAVNGVLSVHLR